MAINDYSKRKLNALSATVHVLYKNIISILRIDSKALYF